MLQEQVNEDILMGRTMTAEREDHRAETSCTDCLARDWYAGIYLEDGTDTFRSGTHME